MTPRRNYEHWYEYAGDFTRDAMKGWGLATLLILVAVGVASWLAINHGGEYLKAQTTKMLAEASASKAVADAVTKLTVLTEQQRDDFARVKLEHAAFAEAFADAKEMMKDAPRQREQTNQLLREMVDELKELRKNDGPLPGSTGSDSRG